MARVVVEHLTKRYGDYRRREGCVARHPARRVPGAARAVRLRQDHDIADDRRLHRAERGHHFARRARRDAPAALEAQHRPRLPVLRAVPASDASRGTSPSAWRCARCPPPRQADASPRRCAWCGSTASPSACRASSRAASSSASRWRALWPSARCSAARRALVESRRQAARRGAHRDPGAAAETRPHHHHGDPRPGRGAEHGRPLGGDGARRDAPGRHAARPLRAPR